MGSAGSCCDTGFPSEAVQAQESKQRKRRIMKIAVYILFGILAVGVFSIWLFYKASVESITLDGTFLFTVKVRTLELENAEEDTVLYGDMGMHLKATPYDMCLNYEEKQYIEDCLIWNKMATLEFSRDSNDSIPCYTLQWKGLSDDFKAEDCFYLLGLKWFGYAADRHKFWPVSDLKIKNITFFPKYPTEQKTNRVPFWLSSNAVSIFLDSNVPFMVTWNVTDKEQFCLASEFSNEDVGLGGVLLKYTICRGDSMKDVIYKSHQHMQKSLRQDSSSDFHPPDSNTPNVKIIPEPIWALSSVDDISKFRDQLSSSEVKCSFLEVFGDWEDEFGDLQFGQDKLIRMKRLLDDLAYTDCKLMLPISTFFTYRSKHFYHGMDNNYFLQDSMGLVTKLISWRGKEGAILDVSNPDARRWFRSHLERLKAEYDIKAFKLLHTVIPRIISYYDPNVTFLNYPLLFSDMITSLNTTIVEDYIAGFTTDTVYAIVHAQLSEVDGGAKCFNSVIPLTLHLGIGGYPLVVFDGLADVAHNEELLAKWLQLAMVFPSFRVPTLPIFNDTTLMLLNDLLQIRKNVIVPELQRAVSHVKGHAIIKPLWWMDENDAVAMTIDDEFLIGDRVLVAPILCEGQQSRRVYLPRGKWQGIDGVVTNGRHWVNVQLSVRNRVPYFIQV
ncbi:myogenesis-regulating glycosidase-like isoform X2 [Gigantopelta aegis]|uniref:myogenesis-regulating glycosidase-like isoform X2 n=1 Tax=Gigantopelta aegis TaxID=1735272 RepID=UPI001B88B4C0|nr:myogenesis-regulating glycosidase-like isoform X2 [Gigantopelta aegis]